MRDEYLNEGVSSLCLMASGTPVLLTGSTSELTMGSVLIPAGLLAPHSYFKITSFWSHTNNANAKTLRCRMNGTVLSATSAANVANTTAMWHGFNRGALNSQVVNPGGNAPYIQGSAAMVLANIDFSIAQTLTITGQLGVGTDSLTLEGWAVEVLNAR